ncbi:MAG TPA: hypothetical protein QF624_10130 [Dehalococcoidia bacterium]|nr:hypothetical protein [Dehalococcoidia bacterium]
METATSVRVETPVLRRDEGTLNPDKARGAAARIPGARFQLVPGSSAEFAHDAEDRIVPIMINFLTRGTADGEAESGAQQSGAFQPILCTDLESSTAFTQCVGDEAAQEVQRGRKNAVRGALGSNDDRAVKHTGDGIMASFPSAVSAVEASLAIQREFGGGEVRARININAGEPIAEEDDIFGTAVQFAARITDRAEPDRCWSQTLCGSFARIRRPNYVCR